MNKKIFTMLLSLATAAYSTAQSLDEGFESIGDGDTAPAGWKVVASGGRHTWSVGHYTDQSMTSVALTAYHSGGLNCMKSQSGKISTTNPKPDQWLISPAVKVSKGDNLSFMMAYDATFNSMATVPDSMKSHFAVMVSVSDTALVNFKDTIYDIVPTQNYNWRSYTLNLDKYAGKTIHLAFREYGNATKGPFSTNYLYIDDVKVSGDVKSDVAPVSLTSPVSGLYDMQPITFSFDNTAFTATGLKAAYSIDGGAPVVEEISGTLAKGDTINYTFVSQPTFSRSADHIVKVWATADNDFTTDNDTISATIHTDAVASLPYEMNQSNMGDVWSYSWHQKSGTRYNGWWLLTDETTNQTYWSYMAGRKTSLLQGKWFSLPKGKVKVAFSYKSMLEVPLSLTITDNESPNNSNASETLPVAEDGGRYAMTIEVPEDGLYQLSVGIGTYAGQLIVEGMEIAAAAPNDASVVEISNPKLNAIVEGTSFNVCAKVMNRGIEALANVPVRLSIDGNKIQEGTIAEIAPGDTVDYTFTAPISPTLGDHKITVYTDMPDDADLKNDTVDTDITIYAARQFPLAESFETESGNKEWNIYNTDNDLLSWKFTSTVVGNLNYAKDGNYAAYMSSATGIKHDDWLISPAINVTESGKARLSYYYTTRMTTTTEDTGTFLTAYLSTSPDPEDISELTALCTDTVTNSNVNSYRQAYKLVDINTPGTYYIAIRNTGVGHDVVVDDIRLDRNEDLAVISASQTATTGFGNTTDKISMNVANHGVSPLSGFTLSYNVNGNEAYTVTYEGTVEPGDTLHYTFDKTLDVSTPDSYNVTVAVADSRDADTFNNGWTLTEFTSYKDATVPYSEDFETEGLRSQWTLYGWKTGDNYSSANSAYNGTSAISHHGKASDKGDWAVSGCIDIPAGTYDLSFFYRTFTNGKVEERYGQNFEVYIGTSADTASMKQLVYTSRQNVMVPVKYYEKVIAPFTVAESGKYYIGVKCTSTASLGVLFVDQVSIDKPVTTGIDLVDYSTDFYDWYQYDPSTQFNEWETSDDDCLQLQHEIFNVGSGKELPRALVSPAVMLSKGTKLNATLDYSMSIAEADKVSDAEKAKMQTGLYISSVNLPDSFQTAILAANDISGEKKQQTATYEVPEDGIYYLGLVTGSAANTTTDKTLITYKVYNLAINAVVSGIVNLSAVDNDSAEVFTADGLHIGSYTNTDEARKNLRHGIYVVRTGGKTIKMVCK